MTARTSTALPLVLRRDAARLLGLSVRAFDALEAEAVIVAVRRGKGGRASLYDLTVIVPAYVAHERGRQGGAVAASRARLVAARARSAELRADREAGHLVDVDAVRKEAFEVARTVRDTLLLIPDRVSAELAAEADSARVHARLDAEIRQTLEALDGPPPARRPRARGPGAHRDDHASSTAPPGRPGQERRTP